MHLKEIKEAVDRGEIVHWASRGYTVEKWLPFGHHSQDPKNDRYTVVCTHNGSAIGLTHQDGFTMNGSPVQFFKRGDHDAEVLARVYSDLWLHPVF